MERKIKMGEQRVSHMKEIQAELIIINLYRLRQDKTYNKTNTATTSSKTNIVELNKYTAHNIRTNIHIQYIYLEKL